MSARPRLEPLLLIARGAQGSVWLAADPQLSRFVAVKIFRLAGDPLEAARHLAEELAPFARAAAASHVLPVLSAGRVAESDGRLDRFEEAKCGDADRCFFLEMPHVLGANARELVASAGALSDREVAALLGQLAPKLAGLHADGEVHLDLKPENVLIEAATGRAFVTDFHLGTKAGTVGYAAPEQAASPGPPCDVYALSRLLLELWTGQPKPASVLPEAPPFVGEAAEARAAHRELASLLAAGLDPNPSSRPTAAEVARRAQEIARRLDLGALDPEIQVALARWKPTEVYLAQKEWVARGLPGAPQRAGTAQRPSPRWPAALQWALVPLALGIIGVTYLRGRPPSVSPSPEPVAAPPAAPAPAGVFSEAVPPRPGGAVRLREGDRVSMSRALFEMKVSFRAKSLAVLSRKDEVLDEIDDPVPGRTYNWEVAPGVIGWSVDRERTGLESRQLELGPHQIKVITPTPDPEMAPIAPPATEAGPCATSADCPTADFLCVNGVCRRTASAK